MTPLGPAQFAGPAQLDPRLLAAPTRSRRSDRAISSGLIVSVLLHSLPLIALIGWQPAVTETEPPTPVPVELVIEQPPPAPPVPKPPETPPPIRGASADMAEAVAPKTEQGLDRPAEHPAETQPPVKTEPSPEPQTAATEPPKPAPPEPQTAAQTPPLQPEPEPAKEADQPAAEETKTAALMPPPLPPKPMQKKPRPAAPTISVPMNSAWPLPLRQERRAAPPTRYASLTGPAAVRDEYCVRALNLTLRHLDLLPRAYVGDRRGKTVVAIRILGDGTINSVKVMQSSGFPDIDQRVARMVFAVGHYPPLPPRIQGEWMDFAFIMMFPEAIQQ